MECGLLETSSVTSSLSICAKNKCPCHLHVRRQKECSSPFFAFKPLSQKSDRRNECPSARPAEVIFLARWSGFISPVCLWHYHFEVKFWLWTHCFHSFSPKKRMKTDPHQPIMTGLFYRRELQNECGCSAGRHAGNLTSNTFLWWKLRRRETLKHWNTSVLSEILD